MPGFKASAPGSLMLLGEHAVLHGYEAVVCAIDKRITVDIVPRKDAIIDIFSALGHYQCSIHAIKVEYPFQFVLGVLKKLQKKLKTGCTLTIQSEFSDQVGFASSASVTVATLSAVSAWLNIQYSAMQLIRIARHVVQSIQGVGSGADVSACVLGGVLLYRMTPLFVQHLDAIPPLTVVYSGKKTPTVQVIQQVHDRFKACPVLFQQLMKSIGKCVLEGVSAIKQQDWSYLGKVMDIQQGLMVSLGVSSPLLNQLIDHLRIYPGIIGAKISGSGLGDCIIGCGHVDDFVFDHHDAVQVKQHVVHITSLGVTCEKT